MIKIRTLAALSGAILALASFPLAAEAQDVATWRPTTAAGGAPVDPNFWNGQARVRYDGGAGTSNNVTVNPTVSNTTYYDYSTPVTNVDGGQTNVSVQGQLANGGNLTVNTQRGDIAEQQNTTTSASSNATLGDGSTVSTSTTSN